MVPLEMPPSGAAHVQLFVFGLCYEELANVAVVNPLEAKVLVALKGNASAPHCGALTEPVDCSE
jgi:hypothetical protein